LEEFVSHNTLAPETQNKYLDKVLSSAERQPIMGNLTMLTRDTSDQHISIAKQFFLNPNQVTDNEAEKTENEQDKSSDI
jgi:hypothetical protein